MFKSDEQLALEIWRAEQARVRGHHSFMGIKVYWVTFKQSSGFRNEYVTVKALTEEKAKQLMDDCYPGAWSMLYDSEEAAGVERFGLRFIGAIGGE